MSKNACFFYFVSSLKKLPSVQRNFRPFNDRIYVQTASCALQIASLAARWFFSFVFVGRLSASALFVTFSVFSHFGSFWRTGQRRLVSSTDDVRSISTSHNGVLSLEQEHTGTGTAHKKTRRQIKNPLILSYPNNNESNFTDFT